MTPAGLSALLTWLDERGYDFVPPTPLTHARALRNGAVGGDELRDLFGWSVAVQKLSTELRQRLTDAGLLLETVEGVRSRLRVARLRGRLFLHSAYPTTATDAVFLGPDSYRFARLIAAELRDWPGGGTLLDIGTGAGVGAVVAADVARPRRIIASDINPLALKLAAVSVAHAGYDVEFVGGRESPDIGIDLAVANPPFLVDDDERAYRHGGAMRGCGVALAMATAALSRLNPGGRLVLYTGSPIVRGRDDFHGELAAAAAHAGATLRYDEIDPDIFGEELERPAYRGVERIALVAAVAVRPG